MSTVKKSGFLKNYGLLIAMLVAIVAGCIVGAMFPNTAKMNELMGYPNMPLKKMMRLVADWALAGGRSINAPTHFETTDGKY